MSPAVGLEHIHSLAGKLNKYVQLVSGTCIANNPTLMHNTGKLYN